MSKSSNSKPQPRNSNGQFKPIIDITPKDRVDLVRSEVDIAREKALGALKQIRQQVVRWNKATRRTDFKRYYAPSDDIYNDNPTGRDVRRPALADLGMCMDHRIGFGHKITRMLARSAIRNRMEFIDMTSEKIVSNDAVTDIKTWAAKTGFWNIFEEAVAYERCYGIGFIVYYWGKDDDFKSPPPKNKPPTSFQAFPPTVLFPLNITETGLLDYDTDVWQFSGGVFANSEIHRDRVFVLVTRPVPFDWLGLSVFEPIWLSTMAYFQVVQGGVKNISKWGEMIPIFRMAQDAPTREMYTEYLDLVDEFRQNYTFVLGQGDSLELKSTELAKGLTEFTEFIKEDIVSGSGTTLNWLFGRSVTGGIGGQGALTAERAVVATIADIQHDVVDPLRTIFMRWWNIKNLRPQFQLDLQKTKASRLIEEQMEIQNDILKHQDQMILLQIEMVKAQMKKGLHLTEGGMGGLLEGTGEKPEANANKGDFGTNKNTWIFKTNININNRRRDLDE